jgi:hypothetical protein
MSDIYLTHLYIEIYNVNMKKKSDNKHYPTISSRDIQRNFSVLKDALVEHGGAYISYYNKQIAKVTAEKSLEKEVSRKKEIDELLNKIENGFTESRKKMKGKSYDELYREEMMKKYG